MLAEEVHFVWEPVPQNLQRIESLLTPKCNKIPHSNTRVPRKTGFLKLLAKSAGKWSLETPPCYAWIVSGVLF